MDNNEFRKILNESIYRAVNKIFEEKQKNIPYIFWVEGLIQQVNKDGVSYDVLINGKTQRVYAKNNDKYSINDIVLIEVANNNYSQKYIAFKKPFNMI